MKRHKKIIYLLIIIFIALSIRLYNFSFPFFTSDEARITYRGYVLVETGRDELGRRLPLIFNSMEDYQLPVTSYLTAGGILLFGKTDFGVRFPFIILGTILVFLIYKITVILSDNDNLGLIAALIASFSPTLIFLSKTPNESIILVFLLTLLFYILLQKQINIIIFILISILIILTSKQSWLILTPFVFVILCFFQEKMIFKKKALLTGIILTISIIAFTSFLIIPQGKRSLMENNFLIFNDITLKNGINRLRGQGIESGWPSSLERLYFNKFILFPVGVLHWLSNIQPGIYFGQFDNNGLFSYSRMGAFSKALIIPAFLGIIFLIREGNKKQRILILFILVITFPAIFIFPKINQVLVIATLPFLIFIITLGFKKLPKIYSFIILFIMAIEIIINIFLLNVEVKNTNNSRPSWIVPIISKINDVSKTKEIAVSDNLVEDIVPYIKWQTKIIPNIPLTIDNFPYKVRQTSLNNIVLHGYDNRRNICQSKEKMDLLVSNRDLRMIEDEFDLKNNEIFKDNLDQKQATFMSGKLCLN